MNFAIGFFFVEQLFLCYFLYLFNHASCRRTMCSFFSAFLFFVLSHNPPLSLSLSSALSLCLVTITQFHHIYNFHIDLLQSKCIRMILEHQKTNRFFLACRATHQYNKTKDFSDLFCFVCVKLTSLSEFSLPSVCQINLWPCSSSSSSGFLSGRFLFVKTNRTKKKQ